jgi:hypothetical protein
MTMASKYRVMAPRSPLPVRREMQSVAFAASWHATTHLASLPCKDVLGERVGGGVIVKLGVSPSAGAANLLLSFTMQPAPCQGVRHLHGKGGHLWPRTERIDARIRATTRRDRRQGD